MEAATVSATAPKGADGREQEMVLDLMAQLDREFTERNKIEALLRELLGCQA